MSQIASITIPRLSETLNPLEWPHKCQRCGAGAFEFALQAWQEHDDADRPQMIYVVLCPKCADRVIEPHPRLYRRLVANEPAPGVMPICGGCVHRVAGRCRSPLARANGGPGLDLPRADSSMHVLYDRRGGGPRGEWIRTWNEPCAACPGREEKEA